MILLAHTVGTIAIWPIHYATTFERLLGCLEQILSGAAQSQVAQQDIVKTLRKLEMLPSKSRGMDCLDSDRLLYIYIYLKSKRYYHDLVVLTLYGACKILEHISYS